MLASFMARRALKKMELRREALEETKATLAGAQQEMSTLQVWLWIVGGIIVLALIFALVEIYLGQ
jgi:hypothetical protein